MMHTVALRSRWILVAASALAVGCANSSGLPSGDAAAGGAGGAGGGAGGAGGSGNGGAAGGQVDGGGNGGNGGPRDGGMPSDGFGDRMGPPRDGGFGGVTDAAPPSPGVTACGAMTCDSATQDCCTAFSPNGLSQSCIAKGGACTGLASACDEPSDCMSGQTCCVQAGGGPGGGGPGGLPQAACVPSDSCTGRGSAVLCHVDADCPMSAPVCCSRSLFVTTISVCQTGC